MEQLRLKFIKLINDTVLISIQNVLTYNYNLGIEWLQEVANRLIPLHKRDMWPIVVDSEDKIIWIPKVKKSKYNRRKDETCDIIYKCY